MDHVLVEKLHSLKLKGVITHVVMYEKNRNAATKVVQDYRRYKVMKIGYVILSPLKLSSNALATNTRSVILLSSSGSSLLALIKFNAEGRRQLYTYTYYIYTAIHIYIQR
jgi:hypothetical protein